jgi:hypothetical protein
MLHGDDNQHVTMFFTQDNTLYSRGNLFYTVLTWQFVLHSTHVTICFTQDNTLYSRMDGFTVYVGSSTDYKQNILCSLNQTFPAPVGEYACTGVGQYVHVVLSGSSKTLHVAEVAIMGCETISVVSFSPTDYNPNAHPSNIFDNLPTLWNPASAPQTYTVVFDVGEGVAQTYWGVHYVSFGDTVHDADTLRMYHSSSSSGPWTQAGNQFPLVKSWAGVQSFNFGQANTNRYWKMEVTKTTAWQLYLKELMLVECWSNFVTCPAGSTSDPCALCTPQSSCEGEELFPPVGINTMATPVLTNGTYGTNNPITWSANLFGLTNSNGQYEVKASTTSSSGDTLWALFDTQVATSFSFGSSHYRYSAVCVSQFYFMRGLCEPLHQFNLCVSLLQCNNSIVDFRQSSQLLVRQPLLRRLDIYQITSQNQGIKSPIHFLVNQQ